MNSEIGRIGRPFLETVGLVFVLVFLDLTVFEQGMVEGFSTTGRADGSGKAGGSGVLCSSISTPVSIPGA